MTYIQPPDLSLPTTQGLENFRWVAGLNSGGSDGPLVCCQQLVAPSGKTAATVFCGGADAELLGSFNWFVWDEQGTGGENWSTKSIKDSKKEAEEATLRWAKHKNDKP